MARQLNSYPSAMWVDGTHWHAVERDGRWEVYAGDQLVEYADNAAIAEAKLRDLSDFEDEGE